MTAVREAGQHVSGISPSFEMLPAKASMSKGRGASDREADEEPEGIRILSVKSSQAGTRLQHKHQPGTLQNQIFTVGPFWGAG